MLVRKDKIKIFTYIKICIIFHICFCIYNFVLNIKYSNLKRLLVVFISSNSSFEVGYTGSQF